MLRPHSPVAAVALFVFVISGWLLTGCATGVEVGTAQPKGCFYTDVEPGSHFVETTTEVSRRLTFTMDKNQTRYVRLSMAMGFFVGHAYPELVEPAEGEKEVATCNYTGGKK